MLLTYVMESTLWIEVACFVIYNPLMIVLWTSYLIDVCNSVCWSVYQNKLYHVLVKNHSLAFMGKSDIRMLQNRSWTTTNNLSIMMSLGSTSLEAEYSNLFNFTSLFPPAGASSGSTCGSDHPSSPRETAKQPAFRLELRENQFFFLRISLFSLEMYRQSVKPVQLYLLTCISNLLQV